jgi:hypothetical protein
MMEKQRKRLSERSRKNGDITLLFSQVKITRKLNIKKTIQKSLHAIGSAYLSLLKNQLKTSLTDRQLKAGLKKTIPL